MHQERQTTWDMFDGTLSVSGVIELACRKSGISPADLDLEKVGLEALVAALTPESICMSALGRQSIKRRLTEAIVKRLRLERYRERFPEIERTEIPSPLFIVAPFRSGTTFLHRLLACDPNTRWTRPWETVYAAPSEPEWREDIRYFSNDSRIAYLQRSLGLTNRLHPKLHALHPVFPDQAEECFGLLEASMISPSFLFTGNIPGYLDWLAQADSTLWQAAYAVYVDQLRLLQWWYQGERWVLKSPVHLWGIAPLAHHLPKVRFVQLHRSPLDSTASFCQLLAAQHATLYREIDKGAIGRLAQHYLRYSLTRAIAMRQQLGDERFFDIGFGQLVSTPLEVIRALYRWLGWSLSQETEARMVASLNNEKHSQRSEQGDVSQFGLQEAVIRRYFAEYAVYDPIYTLGGTS
jgi:hypothetical protein